MAVGHTNYLNDAEIIKSLFAEGKSLSSISKPEMIYLHHPNHFYVFNEEIANKGNLRETFFVNQLAFKHKIETAKQGDFLVNEKYCFEVGGKNKTYKQIANVPDSYIVSDDIETGYKNKIPIWLFGFLY